MLYSVQNHNSSRLVVLRRMVDSLAKTVQSGRWAFWVTMVAEQKVQPRNTNKQTISYEFKKRLTWNGHWQGYCFDYFNSECLKINRKKDCEFGRKAAGSFWTVNTVVMSKHRQPKSVQNDVQILSV